MDKITGFENNFQASRKVRALAPLRRPPNLLEEGVWIVNFSFPGQALMLLLPPFKPEKPSAIV